MSEIFVRHSQFRVFPGNKGQVDLRIVHLRLVKFQGSLTISKCETNWNSYNYVAGFPSLHLCVQRQYYYCDCVLTERYRKESIFKGKPTPTLNPLVFLQFKALCLYIPTHFFKWILRVRKFAFTKPTNICCLI